MTVTDAYNEALLMAARIANERDELRRLLAIVQEAARAEVERLREEMESRATVSQERLQVEGLSLARVLSMRDERDAARAEVERLREEAAGLQDSGRETFVRTLQGCLAEAEADRDRLRAALADTPENVTRVAFVFNSDTDCAVITPKDRESATRVLAALRARAGQP